MILCILFDKINLSMNFDSLQCYNKEFKKNRVLFLKGVFSYAIHYNTIWEMTKFKMTADINKSCV